MHGRNDHLQAMGSQSRAERSKSSLLLGILQDCGPAIGTEIDRCSASGQLDLYHRGKSMDWI